MGSAALALHLPDSRACTTEPVGSERNRPVEDRRPNAVRRRQTEEVPAFKVLGPRAQLDEPFYVAKKREERARGVGQVTA